MNLLSLSTALILGVAVVVIYVIVACVRKKKPALSEAAVIFLSFPGVMGGISVFLRCLDDATSPVKGEERAYFAFAGLAMVWVAIASVIEAFGKTKNA